MTVLVTVVSTSVLQRAIIDSGSKILSAGQLLSGDRRGYGYVAGHPELMVDGSLRSTDTSAFHSVAQ
jgi:D-serine deaminase-like pyridoxal phosphate-dependent protein